MSGSDFLVQHVYPPFGGAIVASAVIDDEMTIVVQKRRRHETCRRTGAARHRRALQRVLELRHRLAAIHLMPDYKKVTVARKKSN